MEKWEVEAKIRESIFIPHQWLNNFSLFPHLLFVQRSGLAGAFSMDKMLWEEYEKADLKVMAG